MVRLSSVGLLLATFLPVDSFIAPAPAVLRHKSCISRHQPTVVIKSANSEEDIAKAMVSLQNQVAQLTAVVKELAAQQAAQNVGKSAGEQSNVIATPASPPPDSKPKIKKGIAGTVDAAPDEILVPVNAAQARIDAFLASSGSAIPLPPPRPVIPAAIKIPAPAPAPVIAVVAPPAPAVAAPPGDGYEIAINWDGKAYGIRCGPDTTVLQAAIDAGIDLPHSCMSGSCLTCPAKLSAGKVDQSEGVLEDDQIEKGFMLTCVSYPLSDLKLDIIEESDL